MSRAAPSDQLQVLAFCGSLRSGSFNRLLLEAAQELAPAELRFSAFDRIGELPPYDYDVEQQGIPESVADLKRAIAAADGLLIATPEYNYSVSGVLKNAIDWASRPPAETPLKGKPVGIIGASSGRSGTMRAQLHLRQIFVFTESYVMLKPEVLVSMAREKFDQNGKLSDEQTRGILQRFMAALPAWIDRFRVPGGDPR